MISTRMLSNIYSFNLIHGGKQLTLFVRIKSFGSRLDCERESREREREKRQD